MATTTVFGCSEPVPGCCEDPPTTTSGATSTDDDTGATQTTPGASASDTSAGPTTSNATSDSTGGPTGPTGGADSDSGSDDTGSPDGAVYSAVALPGGLDRIRVFRRDDTADQCMWMMLVAPGIAGMYPVDTPDGWAVESISISDSAAACESVDPGMFGAEAATAAAGTVGFAMVGMVYPCGIDVDVTADFAGLLPGIPAQVTMLASGIPVTGC
jgi:hypothetical protein